MIGWPDVLLASSVCGLFKLAPFEQTGDCGCEEHIGPAYQSTPAKLQHFRRKAATETARRLAFAPNKITLFDPAYGGLASLGSLRGRKADPLAPREEPQRAMPSRVTRIRHKTALAPPSAGPLDLFRFAAFSALDYNRFMRRGRGLTQARFGKKICQSNFSLSRTLVLPTTSSASTVRPLRSLARLTARPRHRSLNSSRAGEVRCPDTRGKSALKCISRVPIFPW